MAMDWDGSHAADLAHQAVKGINTAGAEAGETQRAVKEAADRIISGDEKNAWQEPATLDRVILAMLLLSVFLPLFAAAHRAAGRRATPPWTPSALTAVVAALTGLLVAYRIVNEPGNDVTTTVKIGAPLGLIALFAIGLGAAWAFQGEVDWAETRRAATAPAPEPAADRPAPRAGRRPPPGGRQSARELIRQCARDVSRNRDDRQHRVHAERRWQQRSVGHVGTGQGAELATHVGSAADRDGPHRVEGLEPQLRRRNSVLEARLLARANRR